MNKQQYSEVWNPPQTTSVPAVDLPRLVRVAELIGSIFFYGNFHAETHNERELEKELRALGYFFESEEELIAKLHPNANDLAMRPEQITEQRSLPGEASQTSEPKVRMSEWFDAMRENSKAFVKMAMTDCQAGPTWQPVIERILTNAYEMGYKAGMDFREKNASNDQAMPPEERRQ